jgi:hypothetical protein
MNRKWIYILLVSALCVTAFCFVAIIFRIFSLPELPFHFVAAFLEAVITAIITVVLLKGQTEAEELKERNTKIFEMKLPLFQNYISELWNISEERNITAQKYREMTKLFYSSIMLYLPRSAIKNMSKYLLKLAGCVGKAQSDVYTSLEDCTFSMINELVKNVGLGGGIDKDIHSEMEEKVYSLFKQVIKEALDNVLVNFSDYCLLNRGEYEQKEDGEYIMFCFINEHPYGCKIMIGPFTNKKNTSILFQLYVPRYITTAVPHLAVTEGEIHNFVNICVERREMPLSLSMPLKESCLIELEQEDCYNDFIYSFSFDDQLSLAPYRRNYAEVAFALGQRAKYIFLNAFVSLEGMPLHKYITRLEEIDHFTLYPDVPWELTESGDLVYT